MQAVNPLVPPSAGQPGGTSAPVANAPAAPDATKNETSRPVTASRESENSRNETTERRDPPPPDSGRGGKVDISV